MESASESQPLLTCTGGAGHVSPINIQKPFPKIPIEFVSKWADPVKLYQTKLDDSTLKFESQFGSFLVNGTEFFSNAFYIMRPSAHLYGGASLFLEVNIKGVSAFGDAATLVVFVELQDMPEYDVFLYTAGLGTGETKAMAVGETRRIYDPIDLNLIFTTPKEGETFLHYRGTSLWDHCETTIYLINKVTVIANAEQINELFDKPSNYEPSPLKIEVYDGTKPEEPKPVVPVNDPKDDLIFDTPLYNQFYKPYPEPKLPNPPQEPEKYPFPDFPYPDAWPWTGEPNYPNDPWYIFYIFPPHPKVQPLEPVEIPPVITYDIKYQEPLIPDKSPNWPFGFPIWPEPTVAPVFPQNWDFFPSMKDKSSPPWSEISPKDPNPRIDWAHPMMPPPLYTYAIPNNYYPLFPIEHWSDDPFNPVCYAAPVIQNIQPITKTPPPVQFYPLDVRLRWPQNPFWNWPENQFFVYPVENRFIWPKDEKDPDWYYFGFPRQDPRWRSPADTNHIAPPIPQRRPEDPVIPNKSIEVPPNATGLSPPPTNTSAFPEGMIPRFRVPTIDPKPVPRPGFNFPDPAQLITSPHANPPFDVSPEFFPYVYKGVPNQPLGIIPPNAIPIWQTPHPTVHLILPVKTPPAPAGTKWIPYFFYPLPHRTKITQRIGLVPQFILVDEAFVIPHVQPLTIPVFIKKPKDVVIKLNPLNPKMPNIINYQMPVVLKPVDPQLAPLMIRFNAQIMANQARLDKNKQIDMINWNRTHPAKPAPGTEANATKNGSIPGQTTPGSNNTTNTSIPLPPPPAVPSNGSILFGPDGMPLRELVGYDDVCDEWKISVLVNRHFQNSQSWKVNDYTLDADGNQKICIRWKKVPRFKEIDPALLKKWQDWKNARDAALKKQQELDELNKKKQAKANGGPYDEDEYNKWMNKDANITRPELELNKIQIEVPCENDLDIVLNDRNFEMPKEVKDTLNRKCKIWVNKSTQGSDYKKYIESLRAQKQAKAQAQKVRQLAFMQMVPLDYMDA
jgi:hypothetical protein